LFPFTSPLFSAFFVFFFSSSALRFFVPLHREKSGGLYPASGFPPPFIEPRAFLLRGLPQIPPPTVIFGAFSRKTISFSLPFRSLRAFFPSHSIPPLRGFVVPFSSLLLTLFFGHRRSLAHVPCFCRVGAFPLLSFHQSLGAKDQ